MTQADTILFKSLTVGLSGIIHQCVEYIERFFIVNYHCALEKSDTLLVS